MIKPHSVFDKFLFQYFPVPQFLSLPSVGLGFSNSMIRFAELDRAGSEFKVGRFGQAELPEGVIEEGIIANKPELVRVLTELRQKHNLHFVRASLPEERVYLFRTELPYMDEADIRGAVRYKIQENVPISLNDAVFDYHFIKQPDPKDKKIELGVAVMSTNVVSAYVDVMHEAGLVPLKLRIESQAIAHAVIPSDDPRAYILVGIQEDKTILAIVSENVVQFSSTLPITGKQIVAAIQKNFNVDESEARIIRQGKEERDRDQLFAALANSASVIRDEIQRLLNYWEGHGDPDHKQITKIMLSGSDALLGFDDYLNQSVGIPAEVANVWVNILSLDKTVPVIPKHDSLDYASALGLALPYD